METVDILDRETFMEFVRHILDRLDRQERMIAALSGDWKPSDLKEVKLLEGNGSLTTRTCAFFCK